MGAPDAASMTTVDIARATRAILYMTVSSSRNWEMADALLDGQKAPLRRAGKLTARLCGVLQCNCGVLFDFAGKLRPRDLHDPALKEM